MNSDIEKIISFVEAVTGKLYKRNLMISDLEEAYTTLLSSVNQLFTVGTVVAQYDSNDSLCRIDLRSQDTTYGDNVLYNVIPNSRYQYLQINDVLSVFMRMLPASGDIPYSFWERGLGGWNEISQTNSVKPGVYYSIPRFYIENEQLVLNFTTKEPFALQMSVKGKVPFKYFIDSNSPIPPEIESYFRMYLKSKWFDNFSRIDFNNLRVSLRTAILFLNSLKSGKYPPTNLFASI